MTLVQEVLTDFFHLAKAYKRGHEKCPILIIDNANCLAVQNPELLNDLQDIAKDGVDDRYFITIFVSSEGHAPSQLLGKFVPLLKYKSFYNWKLYSILGVY